MGPLVAAVLVIGYLVAWGVSPLIMDRVPSDLDLFFWPSAELAAHGHWLMIYSANSADTYPNANGPLGVVALLPVTAIANLLGSANDIRVRAGLADVVAAGFALLLTWQALLVVKRARGALQWQLAASCVFLLAPSLLLGVGDYGHFEQPIELWLVLLAVWFAFGKRPTLAGVALGLALLTRTTALLYVIPFAALPLAVHRVRPSATQLSAAAITAVVGLAPFVVADKASVVHSLIGYRADLPIGAGSIWLAARGTPLSGLVAHGDAYMALALATLLCVAVVWHRSLAGQSLAGFSGLLTVAAACFPMLAKAVFPYYLIEPYVFAAVWWLARPGGALNWRISVPLLLATDTFLAKWSTTLPLTGVGPVEGVVSSCLLAIAIALVMSDLLLGRERPEEQDEKIAAGADGGSLISAQVG